MRFASYWNKEPQARRGLIQGNADYYSTGKLPSCVPPLHIGLPSAVICESVQGFRMQHPVSARETKTAKDQPVKGRK
jgi:hypothetical protein